MMISSITPIAFACLNEQGDITSTVKHKDGWCTFPLFGPDAIVEAREEGQVIAEGSYLEAHRLIESGNKALRQHIAEMNKVLAEIVNNPDCGVNVAIRIQQLLDTKVGA